MRIAVLGWGSLIWDPNSLAQYLIDDNPSSWATDGPLLPIEFARVSNDCRLSLVIVEGARLVPTLWNKMQVSDLAEAIEILRVREGSTPTQNIGYINLKNGQLRCQHGQPIANTIRIWAEIKEFEAVIWTDLAQKFDPKIYGQLTAANVIAYVQSRKVDTDTYERVKTYIQKAPAQIQTAYRSALEMALL